MHSFEVNIGIFQPSKGVYTEAKMFFSKEWINCFVIWLFISRHEKVAVYYIIPSEPFGCPSVGASLSNSNLSSFWPIFFKLCMDIDIREEWVGIFNVLTSFINNRVMAFDWCKNVVVFVLNIFRTNGWILIEFCLCINIYRIHFVSNARYIWSIFNRVMTLDRLQNFVYAQYLVN